ncbi:hypothetical protein FRC07_009480 [Ceratobasidium sp. 392]|nr:hypothetical protein FRC07_009480 [Ceratobasidium sp. 392]
MQSQAQTPFEVVQEAPPNIHPPGAEHETPLVAHLGVVAVAHVPVMPAPAGIPGETDASNTPQ